MTNTIRALQLAIDTFEREDYMEGSRFDEAVKECKASIAELQKCEPVGEVKRSRDMLDGTWYGIVDIDYKKVRAGDKLYTSPQPREWVGLGDKEIYELIDDEHETFYKLARAIEAKLKQLNTKG